MMLQNSFISGHLIIDFLSTVIWIHGGRGSGWMIYITKWMPSGLSQMVYT